MNKKYNFDDDDLKVAAVEIPQCRYKAFDCCYVKENDDEYCEICLLDAICHLKKCLCKLHRSKVGRDDG